MGIGSIVRLGRRVGLGLGFDFLGVVVVYWMVDHRK
jgi:hypothetical protein